MNPNTDPQHRDDVTEEHGAVTLAITNEVNGRAKEVRANPKWNMAKVREHAYTATKDAPRESDRFTGRDPNKDINAAHLQMTLAELTAPGGYLPGEHEFYIRGPVGGA